METALRVPDLYEEVEGLSVSGLADRLADGAGDRLAAREAKDFDDPADLLSTVILEEEESEDPDSGIDAATVSHDLVGLYLREMGEFSLLSPDAERDLAKQLWDEEKRMNAEVFRSPIALEYLKTLEKKLRQGRVRIRDLFGEKEEEEIGTRQRTRVATGFLEQIVRLQQQVTKVQQLSGILSRVGLASLARRKAEEGLEGICEQLTGRLRAFSLGRRVRDGIVREMQRWQARLEKYRQQSEQVKPKAGKTLGKTRGRPRTARGQVTAQVSTTRGETVELEKSRDMTTEDLQASLLVIHQQQEQIQRLHQVLIQANLRLVVSLARTHARRGISFSDLIQEGNLGLMRAVEKFDHRLGCKLGTYATLWIQQALARAVGNSSCTIRTPFHIIELTHKISQASRYLSRQLAREARAEEIAAFLEIPLHQVQKALETVPEPISFDSSFDQEGGRDLYDVVVDETALSPEEEVSYVQLREKMARFLAALPQRDAEILQLRFGMGCPEHTLEEVGERFAVTRERIRQLESKALRKLRSRKGVYINGQAEAQAHIRAAG